MLSQFRIITIWLLLSLILGFLILGSIFSLLSRLTKTRGSGQSKAQKKTTVSKKIIATSESDLSEKQQKELDELIQKSKLLHEQKSWDEYEKILIKGLASFPHNDKLTSLLGNYYFDQEIRAKAYSLLQKLLIKQNDNHNLMRQIATIHLNQKETNKAKVMMQKALDVDPNNLNYITGMSEIYYAEENLEYSIKEIKKIVKLKPHDSTYLIALGMLYEENSEKEKAILYYRRAYSIDPQNTFLKDKLKGK